MAESRIPDGLQPPPTMTSQRDGNTDGVLPQCKHKTTTTINAGEVASPELTVTIDGHEVTALLDTDAEYSIVSQHFADRLRKVKTSLDGPPFRSA